MHFLFSCFCGAISVALGLLRDPTHDVFHVNWAVPWLGPDRYVADISNFSGKIIAKKQLHCCHYFIRIWGYTFRQVE